jgi:hypothetical protein
MFLSLYILKRKKIYNNNIMRVLSDEEHMTECEQFQPIPFGSRKSILTAPEKSIPNLTNIRNSFVPVSAPKSLVDLALAEVRLTGGAKTATQYLRGYKLDIANNETPIQFADAETEGITAVDESIDPETLGEEALPEDDGDAETAPVPSRGEVKRKKLKIVEIQEKIKKGEDDPRVKQSLDVLARAQGTDPTMVRRGKRDIAEEKGRTNIERRRGAPRKSGDPEAMAEPEEARLRGRRKKAEVAEGK